MNTTEFYVPLESEIESMNASDRMTKIITSSIFAVIVLFMGALFYASIHPLAVNDQLTLPLATNSMAQ